MEQTETAMKIPNIQRRIDYGNAKNQNYVPEEEVSEEAEFEIITLPCAEVHGVSIWETDMPLLLDFLAQ